MKFKLTKMEKKWVLYDIGNSAFIMLVTTILPIYFNYLATEAGVSKVNYLAYWGYAASITTLIVALIGPILGTLADTKGFKKPLFLVFVFIGIVGCVTLGFVQSWIWFLGMFIFAKVGFSSSLIFYDSMLPDITTEERMDKVSSNGYAWGYIGSCIPFVASLVIVLKAGDFGLAMGSAMMIAFVLNAAWWLLCTLPLVRGYKQTHYVERQKDAVRASFRRIGETFRDMKKEKKVFIFLIAFFFYIDGVYTIIDMATAYGEALGLDSTGLLLALLVTQIVAFPCALIFGRLSHKIETGKLINVCIIAYFIIAVYAIQLDKQYEFWLLAVCVGMFQGAIQALSRSYFAKIIPAEKSGEYFGILDICGKGASFVGTACVSLLTQITGNPNRGVIAIALLILVGYIFFRKAEAMKE